MKFKMNFKETPRNITNIRVLTKAVRIDGPREGGELGLFQISKAIKTTLTYAMLVRLNSPTG